MGTKTLIIGLDGADRRFIDRMIAAGELPHFKRLRDRSATFEVENDPGQGNVQFWTSAAAGVGPGHHGRYFYLVFNPENYDILLDYNSGLPQVTPFWRRLDDEGYRTGVVDWYGMPHAPLKNGIIMHRWFAQDPYTPSVFHPPEMADVAAKYAAEDPIAEGFGSRPREGAAALKEFYDRILGRIGIKASFFADQLRDGDFDLYVACFSEAHNVGHYYIQYEDEKNALYDAETAAAIPNPLKECYRRLDKAVGDLIAAAGPDASVFVLGGPGMEPLVSANAAFDEIVRRVDAGVGAPLSSSETARRTYHSLIPKGLRNRLAPIARLFRRRLAKNAYHGRRFFAVPHNDNSGAIRINLKGREKYGVVAQGNEYRSVIEEIREGVTSFINPATGRSIVRRVVETAQDIDGPNRDLLPDIFIEWDRMDTHGDFGKVVSEKFGEVVVPPKTRTGDHTPFGFFWAPPAFASASVAKPEDVTAPILACVRKAPPRS
ncbi:alkaline phosphatase family protein [Hyphococcus sp.]|uniref:alkaline phosphatase family protein n=1 Tax=Hyphococcus sp. TaxID=2038636 RepID=UPI003D0E3950